MYDGAFLAYASAGTRVVRNGRVGSVVHADEQGGMCIVDWDPTVEDFSSLMIAGHLDEKEAEDEYTKFLAPLLEDSQ